MLSARDLELEKLRMSALRKEANMAGVAEVAARVGGAAGRAAKDLGGAIWKGAKTVGMGSRQKVSLLGSEMPFRYRDVAGAGVLAGTGTLAAGVPSMVRQARQNQQEAMAPWQGRQVQL